MAEKKQEKDFTKEVDELLSEVTELAKVQTIFSTVTWRNVKLDNQVFYRRANARRRSTRSLY
jgi:hypothetical protein